MALFAIWHENASADDAMRLHTTLLAESHVIPERITATAIDTRSGRWHLAAFAVASHYYRPEAQIWIDPEGGACIIHGLVWRIEAGTGTLLDAYAVAQLLDRPGASLPDNIAGEYAIARLHVGGTLEAFSDPAGLHQLFFSGESGIVSNRAAFAALIGGDPGKGREAGLWLGAIGYRVGDATGWSGARQLLPNARLIVDATGSRVAPSGLQLPDPRGYDMGGRALLTQGLEQAKAAIRLAAGDGPLDLPITGGKDSRAVLAIALAAGLRDRLSLFTRGYAAHPDVVAGAQIAKRLGAPHRREPPRGSDLPADLGPHDFLRQLATIAWQADGGMGGWDNVSGSSTGTETLVSGHLGEVLKAYAKRQPQEVLDPVEMVRLQAPFDPMDLLRAPARAALAARLADQMEAARVGGATEGDLPDLFYRDNRVPNWLGGIRGIKSFERQPILPLGVPALMRLAFLMTAAERKAELAHYKIIQAAAPELIDLPFAHQSWDPSLGAPVVTPILAPAGAPLFGSWQWSVNRVPGVRAALAALFAAAEIPLWEDVDRARLIEALHQRRFDYFDLISLLGFAVAAIHQAGWGLSAKLGGDPSPASAPTDRFAVMHTPWVAGHLDAVRGAAEWDGDTITVTGAGEISLEGWLHAPDWPGATPTVEARVDGRIVAATVVDRHRPDLALAGIGDGCHAFTLALDSSLLDGAASLMLAAPGSESGPDGGRLAIRASAPDRPPAPRV
ncbi:MAG TPA: hypothetical protein VNT42_03500 [Sphingomonas sp.]|nr:hypothetical protein [Sphingomonas sp.]